MADFVVTSTNDSGAGSLRAALAAAEATPEADTITFDAALKGKDIQLTSGPLTIQSGTVTIIGGNGFQGQHITGNNTSRLMDISADATVTLQGLEMRGGRDVRADGNGENAAAGIYNSGHLTMTYVRIGYSRAEGGDGHSGVTGGEDGQAGGNAGIVVNAGTIALNTVWITNSQMTGGSGGRGANGNSAGAGHAYDGGNGGGGGGAALVVNLAGGTASVGGILENTNTLVRGVGGGGGDGGTATQGTTFTANGGDGGMYGSEARQILNLGAMSGVVPGSSSPYVGVTGLGTPGGQGGTNGDGTPGAQGESGDPGHSNGNAITIGGSGDDNYTAIAGSDVFDGQDGNDTASGSGNYAKTFFGGDGSDSLTGGSGNDTLYGNNVFGTDDFAADTLAGGLGDDVFVVSEGDQVVEGSNAGFDRVRVRSDFVMPANIEVLSIEANTGAAATGNAQANQMFGGQGGDTLRGMSGNDTLYGGDGNDRLAGDQGTDFLDGGYGSDTYINPNDDTINEIGPSGEIDTIETNATLSLSDFKSGSGYDVIEDLRLTGSADIDGVGNTLANRITGNGGANRLSGGDGNDTLIGAGGKDTLEGGSGADEMRGGQGNDTYVNPDLAGGDTIIEAAGAVGGNDIVQSNTTFSLTALANVERLFLTGSANLNGTGNALDNTLTGNGGQNRLNGDSGNDWLKGGAGNDALLGDTGADTLDGGDGADTLVGGKGNDLMSGGADADLFRFLTAPGSTGKDTITGFETALDRFDLSGGAFTSASETAAGTTLVHAGGSILVRGVFGLTLGDWNALVVGSPARAYDALAHDAAVHAAVFDVPVHDAPAFDAPAHGAAQADWLLSA